jgi:hypothetical protein
VSLAAERDLPVVDARWDELRRRYIVDLPGSLRLECRDEADVEAAVRRYAPWSAIRYHRPPGN